MVTAKKKSATKPLPPGQYKAKISKTTAKKNQVHVHLDSIEPIAEQRAANPKDTIGSMKVPMTLVPSIAIQEQALAFLEGKLKYGEVNWRAAPVRASIYLDAAARHHEKYVEGDDRDPVTRVHHLANAMACYGIILDAQHYGTLIDDRKMSNGNVNLFMDAQVDRVKHLYELFKDKTPKHFKIDEPVFGIKEPYRGSKGRNQM